MPALRQTVPPSWTATLRLPRSRFPPRPQPADRAKYLQRCSDDLYEWQRRAEPPRTTPFVLHDGPPYANGSLHVGHALNKILKDITNRTRLLKGHRIDYVPGWDCHGLPIELKALQQGKTRASSSDGKQLGAAAVRAMALRLALKTVEEQKTGFRQWAIMADWENAWKTADKKYELAQLRVFKTLLEKGLIYQSNKPVYWSPSSRTALAEAELEYKPDHESTAAFVLFSLLKVPVSLRDLTSGKGRSVSVAVWTTTPWTLVANRAIAVHQALDYVLVDSKRHGCFILAESRLAEVERACDEELSSAILAKFQGSELVGASYAAPLVSSQDHFPILHAAFVSSESGTGIVHMAPGHGMDDYKLCRSHGIQPFAPVDDVGCFMIEALSADLRHLEGQHVQREGNQAILDLLKSRGTLINAHTYKHSYPYDWRSKQPVIIRATKQWFANVESIRESTLKSLEAVEFIPDTGKDRLSSFIRSRTEWCISRQRPWGVPIPALYHNDTHEATMTPESVKHIIDTMIERGSEAWWTDDRYDTAWVPPSLRNSDKFYRGQDTMDVWFDSGTSWTQMADIHNGQPAVADVYLEGTDQHRGWFQSSLLTHIATQSNDKTNAISTAPYKTLITHGFTLDHNGSKMSKSIGNVVEPDQIMQGTLLPPIKRKPAKGAKPTDATKVTHDALGADALRMWVATSDYTRDIAISQPVLQAVNNSVSKLRVTFKLLLGFLDNFEPTKVDFRFQDVEMNNQLALIRLQRLTENVHESFDAFEYHKAVNAINNYIATDLSAGYVEAIKDRMYTDAANSNRRFQAQAVAWEIFKRLTETLSPIVPLLVEEALDHLPAQLKYHPVHTAWQAGSAADKEGGLAGPWANPVLDQSIPDLNELNGTVKALQEQARSQKKMGSSLQSDIMVYAPSAPRLYTFFQKYRKPIEDMLVVSQVTISDEPIPSSFHREDASRQGDWSFTSSFTVNEETAHVIVTNAKGDKCVRCWKYVVPEDHGLEDSLCVRCVGVLECLRDDMPEVFEGKPRLDEAAKSCRHHSDVAMQEHWTL